MTYQRREFLKLASAFGAGLALTSCTSKLMGNNLKGRPYGLQLYSLRDDLPKDPKGVLKQVASFGYKQVEGFEGSKGMFWGMTNTEFKRYMDDLGMKIVSSHCNIDQNFQQKADQAAAIGMSYLLAPYLGPQKELDDYKRAAEKFNQRGETCRKAGLKFGYHNHDYSFKAVNGVFPQDIMMQNTDPSLVDFEMDIYWVVTAGQDPIAWINKYPNRFKLAHIKDRQKNVPLTEKKNVSVVLGTGEINFPAIIKAGKSLDYLIVEQEAYEGTTPLAAAKGDAEYMKRILS
ncbi:MAG: sugar phosphate isomerase/epimerase [Chitinophagaceae bacterium]|nr:sugar phosphate isomerase/epimerase [Chitinophagaceae bacterium]